MDGHVAVASWGSGSCYMSGYRRVLRTQHGPRLGGCVSLGGEWHDASCAGGFAYGYSD
jgi:hypothetical protein